MRRDDLFITIPTFFRCPISLEVMKSPVSLTTGVTYDRTSIQRWLDGGNNTCPATMQLLATKEFVPNHTLQRLIQIWSDSTLQTSSSSSVLTTSQASQIAGQILLSSMDCSGQISKLLSFALVSGQNRKLLASIDGFCQFLIGIGADNANLDVAANLCSLEESVMLLQLVLSEDIGERSREKLDKYLLEKRDKVSLSTLFLLQKGNLSSRIAAAKVMELLSLDAESKLYFANNNDLLSELFRLATCESDPEAIDSGLSCLICISIPKRAKLKLIKLGAVQTLSKMLNETNLRMSATEKVLKLLEMASTTKEGRSEICGFNGECLIGLLKKILKVSTTATEHAVTILWSLCCVFRDAVAQEIVTSGNGGTKMLLLMQSNCSPAVRQMASDLLKIFRVKSKGSCLSSYETKTTHIMPF
ncbi:U-box domain-containing protein 27-like [Impatiens glandulifera]|uniref:U-box domain-containing protein 27-like n=1 Tax=Impatiens glandulifera TaxID=253017 RepID=UPI001FB0F4E5|nr:U-box domain-containing protein 27-like [Impatiens glandulifera]